MIQLEGTVTLASTDYSSEITSCVLRRQRRTSVLPPTFGNKIESAKAGAEYNELTINFINEKAASKVWSELFDAIDTDTGEIAFTAKLDDGATGSDNPEFSGTIVVTGAEFGGTVGQVNTQSQTFPITNAGVSKAVA